MPVLQHVKPFAFVNQSGEMVTEQKMDGKVYVAEFFFTTCQGVCPKMNSNMKKIFEKYRNEPGFAILSHTSDPETDSVPRLRAYADSLKVNGANWWFVTGRKDSLYTAARESYLLDDPANNNGNIQDQFLHTQFFALVDRSGRVRKIYDGLKKDEVELLKKDIAVLLKEPPDNKRFVNNIFGN
jgi:protein SCO1/2